MPHLTRTNFWSFFGRPDRLEKTAGRDLPPPTTGALAMTDLDNITISELFSRREALCGEMLCLGYVLDQLHIARTQAVNEKERAAVALEYRRVDVVYDRLYDQWCSADEAMAYMPINSRDDLTALGIVAVFRAGHDDGGLSAEIAAALDRRIHDVLRSAVLLG
jgi:hypothetical protein